MSRPDRRPGTRRPADPAPSGPTTAPYLAPAVPEVAALLGASERVLVACGRAEDDHADRAIRIAATADPCTLPVSALVGPALPAPLASRVAFRALQRLALALRPVLRETSGVWSTPGRGDVAAFRALRVDTTDLALLGQAAARLTHPRRTREGTLGVALGALRDESGEAPDHRHPAALGCLLAVLVPVVDPVALTVYDAAQRHPDVPVLDAAALEAHREIGRRVVGALARS
jgi:hypothetical protein